MSEESLDERVARKLGWEPLPIRWTCTVCGLLTYGTELNHLAWPPISTSWEWAGKAIEEARRRGIEIQLTASELGFWALGIKNPDWVRLFSDSGPLAIAQVIDAVLPESEDSHGTFGLYDGLPSGTAAEYLADVQTRAKWMKE